MSNENRQIMRDKYNASAVLVTDITGLSRYKAAKKALAKKDKVINSMENRIGKLEETLNDILQRIPDRS